MEAPLLFFALFVRKAFVLMCPYGEEHYSLFLDTAAAICYTEWEKTRLQQTERIRKVWQKKIIRIVF